MSLLKSMHCMSQVMVKGNPEDNGLYSQNTSNVLWEIWTACWIMVNYQPWPMTAVAGGNLWSPAPQPNDDDEYHITIYSCDTSLFIRSALDHVNKPALNITGTPKMFQYWPSQYWNIPVSRTWSKLFLTINRQLPTLFQPLFRDWLYTWVKLQ